MSEKIAAIAIRGSSLVKDKVHQSVEDQFQTIEETSLHIDDMIEDGCTAAIGHGNEPQVGFVLRRGKKAIITNPDNIARALRSETGTTIVA